MVSGTGIKGCGRAVVAMFLIAAVGPAAMALAAPDPASDKRVPHATMSSPGAGDDVRFGYAYKLAWTQLRGSISEPETAVCITETLSSPGVLRRSLKVDPGTRHAHVTFHKSARPERVAVWRWPRIKRVGE